ncbi:WYL domain-containing protein [Aquihabitans sp. G128]|uniref:helix-turn-helix transcriptional regulator n=1 Tax=Aquihabitans sp. G128 TaxID=2849779 RepID=UPI001C21C488|nr:WYL domain-containing protein [Aquihabitans sp. G128]QXC63219.1 WYL domain-containing protein [Aquihabitans sp. G128]
MNRTDRLHAIGEALRAAGPRGLTAAALADRFEVATRTIKRDVTALQEGGVPIAGIGGPGGGYVLDAAATLPPVTFTVGEAIAVAVALARADDQPFAADGRRALTKLVGVVPERARDAAETLAGRVWVRGAATGSPGAEAGGASAPRSAQRAVEEAVRTGTVVLVDYVDAEGATSIRRPVEALGLAHDGFHWHLLAWCRRRDAARWFRLDRITAAHPTTEPVVPRDVATAFGVPPPDAGPVTLT